MCLRGGKFSCLGSIPSGIGYGNGITDRCTRILGKKIVFKIFTRTWRAKRMLRVMVASEGPLFAIRSFCLKSFGWKSFNELELLS